MGEAGRLARDRAQAEAPGGVERRALQPAVVERQALGLAVLEEQLAVVDAGETGAEQPHELIGFQVCGGDEAVIETGQIGHARLPSR